MSIFFTSTSSPQEHSSPPLECFLIYCREICSLHLKLNALESCILLTQDRCLAGGPRSHSGVLANGAMSRLDPAHPKTWGQYPVATILWGQGRHTFKSWTAVWLFIKHLPCVKPCWKALMWGTEFDLSWLLQSLYGRYYH